MNDPTPQSPDDPNALRAENAALRERLDDLAEHHTDHHDAEAEADASDNRLDAPACDLVRSHAIGMLAASHESTVIDLSLAMATAFALRGVKREWGRPSRQNPVSIDLGALAKHPMVQQVIAKVTGMGAAPEAPVPDEPNLTVLGPQNTVLVVKRGETEASRRVIPATGTRSLRLPPALYVVEVYPPSCTVPSLYYADLIDDAVTIDVSASLATPPQEPIVPDAPATPAGELPSEEAVPS